MNKYSIEGKKTVNNFKHVLKIMRITLFLLFFGILFSQAATGYSQGVEVILDLKSASIKQICEEIEKKSDFRFIFAGNANKSIHKKVEITTNSQNIEKILDNILSDTDLIYNILDNQIVVYRNKEKDTSKEIEKSMSELAVQQQNIVKGYVTDSQGQPLPGVTIIIEGTTRGVITDIDGTYSINAKPADKLIFSFVGMENQIVDVNSRTIINVVMSEKVDELEEVTIVAFGKQKKESVTASITTVRPEELKVPSSNLTTALAGRMSGLISYQRSGEPGEDDASFFIRVVTTLQYGAGPLILIDGVEMSSSELSRQQPHDIAS